MNESDRLAALAAETGVLRVHEQDVEFLKQPGELYRCRAGMPGESVGGVCVERSPDLVIVTFCSGGGVCRRLVDSAGDRKLDETRHALPENEAWFADHPAERYRARPLPPFQGPDLSADERARRLLVVERTEQVVPWTIALDCEEVCR